MLAGCVATQPVRTPEVSLPQAFTTASQSGNVAALDRYWTLYDDPQLTALTERALAQGFSVREAIARLEEARAQRGLALAAYDPQGSLQAGVEQKHSRSIGSQDVDISGLPDDSDLGGLVTGNFPGDTRSAQVTLPVSWELGLFGRRDVTQESADAQVAAARFEVEAARAAIAAEVARSLFQARGLASQRDDALETVRIQTELLQVLSERARRGLIASSEADRVAGDLAQAQAQAADADAALNASRRALLAVIGDAGALLDSVPIAPAATAIPPVPEIVPSTLLARRPDVRQAFAGMESAAGNVRLAELDFLPHVTLGRSAGIATQRGPIDSTTGFWSLAAGLVVPILDRNRLTKQLHIESARAEQAVLRYERTVQTAFSESDQALIRLEADRGRLETLAKGERRARSAYDAACKRYDLGFSDLTDLLDAERAWRSARTASTSARTEALQRSVQAFQALGGGWDSTTSSAGNAS